MNRPVEPVQAVGESATMVMGPVALAVTNLERSLSFYENVLGCSLLTRNENTVVLGSEKPLLLLTELRDAAPRPSYTTGLYHVALLLPGRVDLACALRHLLERGYPLQNMEDHGISEALYLSDPDGNGIELYRDRPRSAWPWHKGKLEVHRTEYAVEQREAFWLSLMESSTTGQGYRRLHASVISISGWQLCCKAPLSTRMCWASMKAFTGISGACFFATGGYHHHIACNVWTSLGAPVPPSAAPGLRFFTLVLP